MKRLLLLITICISTVSFGQYTSIPDPNFEQALIDLGHDDVIDGQVLTANVSSVTYLNLYYLGGPNPPITDLTGINDFINLQYLDITNNSIASLEVNNIYPGTSISFLEELYCGNNPLTFISLTNNSELMNLDISGTHITTLDVSNLENLRDLDFSSTGISQIDLTNNVNLEGLRFGDFWYDELNNELLSPISTINLSNNYLLMDLSYYGGLLEYIDLSNLIGYSDISFEDCFALECINLANGTNGVNWDGNLISGSLSGGDPQLISDFGLPPQPPLCIQVDDVNISNTLWVGNFDVYHPDYTFSTDCGDCSGTSNLTELNPNQPKELIKIVNLLGQEVEYTPNTVLIYQYADGTSEKVFTIED